MPTSILAAFAGKGHVGYCDMDLIDDHWMSSLISWSSEMGCW